MAQTARISTGCTVPALEKRQYEDDIKDKDCLLTAIFS